MNTLHSIRDSSIFSNHSEHHRHHDHCLEDEYVIGRRRISLDHNILFSSESSSIGYLLEQKGIQKDNKNSIVLNKKKGGSCTYSLEKPKISYMGNDDDDESLDLSARKVMSATEAIQKALKEITKDGGKFEKKHPSVQFAIDPNTNDMMVNDINQEINRSNGISGSCSNWNESFNRLDASWNGSSMCLDLSFDNIGYDSSCGLDFADVVEEKIEKISTNLFTNRNQNHGGSNNNSSIFFHFERSASQLDSADTTEDGMDLMINDVKRRSPRKRRPKFQQFYKRKDYRSAYRTAKHAADEFILHNEELVHEFYQFYMSSLSSTSTTDKNSDDAKNFLKRWCESDGRGLEHAILLSYLMSKNDPGKNDMDVILIKKINDAKRYEQIPSLSSSMAHQFALMDAIIV